MIEFQSRGQTITVSVRFGRYAVPQHTDVSTTTLTALKAAPRIIGATLATNQREGGKETKEQG